MTPGTKNFKCITYRYYWYVDNTFGTLMRYLERSQQMRSSDTRRHTVHSLFQVNFYVFLPKANKVISIAYLRTLTRFKIIAFECPAFNALLSRLCPDFNVLQSPFFPAFSAFLSRLLLHLLKFAFKKRLTPVLTAYMFYVCMLFRGAN